MGNRDIQIGACNGGFRLYDIAVTVVALGYLCFGLAFRSGAYLIHLPEDVFEKLFFAVVHCGDFLRIVGVGIGLDGINRKCLFPDCTASRHFQNIVSCTVLDFVKFGIVFRIDFSHNCLHCHTVSRVLARKEDTEHRANKQTDKADNDDYHDSNPTACGNRRNQCLCSCNNRLDRRNGRFHCNLYGVGGSFCCCFRCLCCSLSRLDRSLCSFLCRLCGMLGGLDSRL